MLRIFDLVAQVAPSAVDDPDPGRERHRQGADRESASMLIRRAGISLLFR